MCQSRACKNGGWEMPTFPLRVFVTALAMAVNLADCNGPFAELQARTTGSNWLLAGRARHGA